MDKWRFYQDERRRWRWVRIAPNGRVVGASTQGYRWKVSAKRNARRLGWTP